MHKTSRISANTVPPKPALQVTAEKTSENGALSPRPVWTKADDLALAGGLLALGAVLGPAWGIYVGAALAIPSMVIILLKVWFSLVATAKTEVQLQKGP